MPDNSDPSRTARMCRLIKVSAKVKNTLLVNHLNDKNEKQIIVEV